MMVVVVIKYLIINDDAAGGDNGDGDSVAMPVVIVVLDPKDQKLWSHVGVFLVASRKFKISLDNNKKIFLSII